MGKTKDLSALQGMVEGMVEVPGAPVYVKNCNAAGFFMLNSFPCASRMVHQPKDISQLYTTVGSIGVNIGQHPCGTLSIPCGVHALTNRGCSEATKGGPQY